MILSPENYRDTLEALVIMRDQADKMVVQMSRHATNMERLRAVVILMQQRDKEQTHNVEPDGPALLNDRTSYYEAHQLIERLKGGGV